MDTWRELQDTEMRKWRERQDEAIRWLIAGQQDIYRRLDMQPCVAPMMGPSTQHTHTSKDQAGTSSQQPPIDDSQFF